MNNTTANMTSISSVLAGELVHQAYISYAETLVVISALALLFYTMVLAIPQEVEYMWLSPKPFTIPNMLYAFTRYASLIDQLFYFSASFVPLGSLCNSLVNVGNGAGILAYIGVQGLLITRAYSLCKGNKFIAGTLAFFFLGGFILTLYETIVGQGCIIIPSSKEYLLSLISNICVVSTDVAVFCICWWKLWDTWKSKHEAGIQSNNDLVSVLLKQTVSRFCFVIIISVALGIVNRLANNPLVVILGSFQHSFSAILLADFTLDLRQRNSGAIQSADLTLPTIQFQTVMNYIHQSILIEMGDHDDESEFLDIESQLSE